MSEELLAIALFSGTGIERRFEYLTFPSGNKKIQYYGAAPIGAPTDAERWRVGKLEYDANECMVRQRERADQKAWDDRASLFP